ncbi:(2Fe-2S)-binding protein [Alicyclobacillus macrosporangiidus]|uniref:(2Fe-2S)-binding protein n=1 Tax=Alicyclobacillus macrosporangiidus TaxID=392015 RepID=UPI0018CC35CE
MEQFDVTKEGAKTLRFRFDGKEFLASSGQTLAAALMSAGVWGFSSSRTLNQPRGTYCGSGWCCGCLVVVDGQPRVRACMTLVQAGMTVEPQCGDPAFERRDARG